jgi:hypothetical protein
MIIEGIRKAGRQEKSWLRGESGYEPSDKCTRIKITSKLPKPPTIGPDINTMITIPKALTCIALALFAVAVTFDLGAEEKPPELAERVAALEKQVTEIGKTLGTEEKNKRLLDKNKENARKRAAKDKRHYNPEELAEIETLYKEAGKNPHAGGAINSLMKLQEKYAKSNYTGCATLTYSQENAGKDQLYYVKEAVRKYSDCYYPDGCQVGAYARLLLSLMYWESGEKDEALALLDELITKFRDATDHNGSPISEIAAATKKILKART